MQHQLLINLIFLLISFILSNLLLQYKYYINMNQKNYFTYEKETESDFDKYSFLLNQVIQGETNVNEDQIQRYFIYDRSKQPLHNYVQNEDITNNQTIKNSMSSKQAIKLRNKINAKKSREKKKQTYSKMVSRCQELQEENIKLKGKSQYCKFCKKNLHKQQNPIEKCEQIQFTEPNFNEQQIIAKQKDYKQRNIWIAISIIILIMGINMHGLDHGRVDIKNEQKLYLNSELSNKKDYIQFPLGFLEQKQLNKQKRVKQFKSNRIHNQGQYFNIQQEKDQQLKINKFFLWQLENEINDIGRYI